MRTARPHGEDAATLPHEGNGNVCPLHCIPDLDLPRPPLLKLGGGQNGLEAARLNAAVGLINTLPVSVDKMTAQIGSDEHDAPGGGTCETSFSAAPAPAKADRGELKAK